MLFLILNFINSSAKGLSKYFRLDFCHIKFIFLFFAINGKKSVLNEMNEVNNSSSGPNRTNFLDDL